MLKLGRTGAIVLFLGLAVFLSPIEIIGIVSLIREGVRDPQLPISVFVCTLYIGALLFAAWWVAKKVRV